MHLEDNVFLLSSSYTLQHVLYHMLVIEERDETGSLVCWLCNIPSMEMYKWMRDILLVNKKGDIFRMSNTENVQSITLNALNSQNNRQHWLHIVELLSKREFEEAENETEDMDEYIFPVRFPTQRTR